MFVSSAAEVNEKVYVSIKGATHSYFYPLMYDCNKDKYMLPALPDAYFSIVTVPDKKQLLAIRGMVINSNFVVEISSKVFLWDEENRKWTTPYPNMPTARCYIRIYCTSISHESTVIIII